MRHPPGDDDLDFGSLLDDQAEPSRGWEPVAFAAALLLATAGIVIAFSLFLADSGVVAGVFPALIGIAGGITLRWLAGFLLEAVGHQKTRGVPDRWRLGQPLVTARHVVPARADQIELQGFDQLLTDLSGGGHGGIVV